MFTELLNKKIYITESPSSRGRGLKLLYQDKEAPLCASPSSRGRGLK